MRGTRESIWHDAEEEPQTNGFILIYIDDYEGIYDTVSMEWVKDNYSCWNNYSRFYNVAKWCYISDIENL